MRDSIFYSAIRALFVAFFTIIGICLGFIALSILLGAFSSDEDSSKLKTVNTEEILPNVDGKRKIVSQDAPVILQINITGIIGTESLDTDTIRQMLVESREGAYKNNRVKGLFLFIDTPGGTVTDADGIYRALLEYKKKYNVPIYAYVDGLCASGGMYVALAADKILSSDISLIGSIGVLIPSFMNFTKLLDKIGVETLTLSAGKEKDAMNPLRPWKPGEEDNYREIVDYYYNNFVDLVVAHRPAMDKEKLIEDYGAKIFPAPIALEYGYIDSTGNNLSEALKELLEKSGITDENYQVITLESKGWWKSLFSSQSNALFSGKIKHQLTISPEIDLLFRNQYLYLYSP